MKIFKYPYGLFVLSIFIFIGGIILEIKTFEEVKHIPVTFVSSIFSFVLLVFGLIHLAIYKKVSAEKYLAKSAEIIYWFGMLLLMFVLLKFFVFSFGRGISGIYNLLLVFYFLSHLVLLVWLIIDQIFSLKDKSKLL